MTLVKQEYDDKTMCVLLSFRIARHGRNNSGWDFSDDMVFVRLLLFDRS